MRYHGNKTSSRRNTVTSVAGIAFAAVMAVLPLTSAAAQEIGITQVDTSRLLTRQEVSLYVDVSDEFGAPIEGLTIDQFKIRESSDDGQTFAETRLTGFTARAAEVDGITFYLVVDNSGSMYRTIDGSRTDDTDEMRIAFVRDAIRTFLRSIDGPRDAVGLAEFNTRYTLHSEPTRDTELLEQTLDRITYPARGDEYTELHAAIIRSAEKITEQIEGDDAVRRDVPRRRAIILLSDGEDFPFIRGERRAHPEYGERIFTADESIEALRHAGVSLYVIRFGDEKEQSVDRITAESGGRVYDAGDVGELTDVYLDIRERVLREYRITYRATMSPAERRILEIELTRDGRSVTGRRTYFAGTLLGLPGSTPAAYLLIALALALVLWYVASRLRFANSASTANLEVLAGGATKVFPITGQTTVIGSSNDDDLTITGAPNLSSGHATIVHDEKRQDYTVVSDAPFKINNRRVEKGHRLSPGDVINVDGTLIVFDEPVDPKRPKQ